MRYFKKTFIWVIVLTLLGGYYFIDLKRDRILKKERDEATRLLHFSPLQVLKIQLKKEDRVIVLKRGKKGWSLTSPVKAPAVTKEVEKFLRYVTDSKNDADYIMDPHPTKARLKEFGLDKPDVVVTLFVGRNLTPHTIFFGKRAPSKGVAFAQVKGDPKVYRILTDAKWEADQDVHYFRNKTIVHYDPVMIDQVEISSTGGGVIRCELPMDGKWRITAPIRAKGDITKIMGFLSAFKNGEIKEFVEEDPKDLLKYGLAPERKKIAFRISGESVPSNVILVGKRDKKKRGVYALLNGKKNVVLLKDKLLDYVPDDPFVFMNKELFNFAAEDLSRLKVFAGTDLWEFEKKPDYSWREVHPVEKAVDFNPIMNFLQKAKKFTIRKLVRGNPSLFKTAGLDRPAYKIVVSTKLAKEEQWVAIGNKVAEEGYYAMAGGTPDIFIIGVQAESDIKTFLGGEK